MNTMRVVLVYAEDTNAADDLRHALRMLGGARPFKPVPPGENPATYTQERFSEEETDVLALAFLKRAASGLTVGCSDIVP